MNAAGFVSCHEWIYPDRIPVCLPRVELYAVSGGSALVQHVSAPGPAPVSICWVGKTPAEVSIWRARRVCVDQNTAATLMTTLDYSTCKEYVTRQAPFFVYDALYPEPCCGASASIDAPPEDSNYKVLCIELRVADTCASGTYKASLLIGQESWSITLHVKKINSVQKFSFFNFTNFENIAKDHGIVVYSDAYWPMFARYVRMQKHLRCTHVMVPSAIPVYDEAANSITAFDFSPFVNAVETALAEGIEKMIIAPIAHWKAWNDSTYVLKWDPSIDTQSFAAYALLKKYCGELHVIICEKKWERTILHSIADEPQTFNDCAYRAMSAIFRKLLPSVKIVEAVETTDLGGAVDIWVPKQHTYEQHKIEFDALKNIGETFWYYTCAFPANSWMNRSMDLPLAVSKALLWMGFYHDFTGYLHWGLNFYIGDNVFKKACCPHKGALLPAGDAHILYPGATGPLPSLRALVQMQGVEDVAALAQAEKNHAGAAKKLVADLCQSFSVYEKSARAWDDARAALFDLL